MVVMADRVKEVYKKNALDLLIKHGASPSREDIRDFMCFNDHCPAKGCTYPRGRTSGQNCGHVINVKLLTNKIMDVIMED